MFSGVLASEEHGRPAEPGAFNRAKRLLPTWVPWYATLLPSFSGLTLRPLYYKGKGITLWHRAN